MMFRVVVYSLDLIIKMQILVKAPGKFFRLYVLPSDTVESIKEKLQNKMGLPPEKQCLHFNGKRLEDKQILNYYNIQNEGILQLETVVEEGCSLIGINNKDCLPLVPLRRGSTTIFINGCIKRTLLVDTNYTVQAVKAMIQGIPPDQQQLIYGETYMEDERTLSYYGVQPRSIFYLSLRLPIYVKTQAGEIIPLLLNTNDTIEKVKSKLEVKIRIPPNQQELIFSGVQLEDRQTLSYYDISRKSILHLVPGKGMSPILISRASHKIVGER